MILRDHVGDPVVRRPGASEQHDRAHQTDDLVGRRLLVLIDPAQCDSIFVFQFAPCSIGVLCITTSSAIPMIGMMGRLGNQHAPTVMYSMFIW